MAVGKKREQTSLTLDGKVFSVGDDLDAVYRFAGQAICRAQNLDGTDEIQFLHRRHNQDDDTPLLVRGAFPAEVAIGRGHFSNYYATPRARCQAGTTDLAKIVGTLAEKGGWRFVW